LHGGCEAEFDDCELSSITPRKRTVEIIFCGWKHHAIPVYLAGCLASMGSADGFQISSRSFEIASGAGSLPMSSEGRIETIL